jgi:hypothetical protein|uniref:hypothetical protein n=1 Tax=Prosthecobacter sp. TaxID=1965333 RepID=UPI003783DDC5
MKQQWRGIFLLVGGALLLAYMFHCVSDPGPEMHAHIVIPAISNLNHALLNRTATDSNFVPAEDFWSMIEQLGRDPDEMAAKLQYGTLYYRGGRLESRKDTVRFLYASDFGSAAYFTDGSNTEFNLSSKVFLSEDGKAMPAK